MTTDDQEAANQSTTRVPQPVDIILATLRRANRAGESHEMAARWIMEDLHAAGWGFGRWRPRLSGDIEDGFIRFNPDE